MNEESKIWEATPKNKRLEFSFVILGNGWWLQHLKFVSEINKSVSDDFKIKDELINQMDKLKDCNFAKCYYSVNSGGKGRIDINNIFQKDGKIQKTKSYLDLERPKPIKDNILKHFLKKQSQLINFCALFFYDLLNNAEGYYENWFEKLKEHKTKDSWNKVLSDFIERAKVKYYIDENENFYFMKCKEIRIDEGNIIFTRKFDDINSPEELKNGPDLKQSIDDFSFENMLGVINVLFSTVLFTTEKFSLITRFNGLGIALNEKLKFFSCNINKEFAKDDNKNTEFIFPATTNYVQPPFPYEYNNRIVFLHGKFVNNGNFPFIKGIFSYKGYTDQIERGKDNVNDKTSFFNLYIYGLSSKNENYLIKEVIVDREECWKNIYISYFTEDDKKDWEDSLNEINPSLLEKTKFIKSELWWIEDKDGKVFSKF